MARPITTLLENSETTGADVAYPEGLGHLMVTADIWNGATAQLEVKAPNGVYIPVEGASFTANGMCGLTLGECTIRMKITGAPTNVSAWFMHVEE